MVAEKTNHADGCLLFWKRTARGLNASGLGIVVSTLFGSLKAPCSQWPLPPLSLSEQLPCLDSSLGWTTLVALSAQVDHGYKPILCFKVQLVFCCHFMRYGLGEAQGPSKTFVPFVADCFQEERCVVDTSDLTSFCCICAVLC